MTLHVNELADTVMPRSHRQVKLSRNSRTKWSGRWYLVAIIGFMWLLRGLRGTNAVVTPLRKAASYEQRNAVVTPLRKAASYEPRIAILGIWGDTWLTRGKYGIYVAVRGSYGALTGST